MVLVIEMKVGSNFLQFSIHFLVVMFDFIEGELLLPVKSLIFSFLVKLIDAVIMFDVFAYSFRLSIVDFLYFSQMFQVHFVSHLCKNDVCGSRVYHWSFHWLKLFDYYRDPWHNTKIWKGVVENGHSVLYYEIWDFEFFQYHNLDWMDETYDVVVCGTGLIECVLSGLLSQEGNESLSQARKSYTSTATVSMEVKEPQSTWQISGKFSERKKSLIRIWDTTETGILTSFPSTSCTEANLSKFFSRLASPNILSGNVAFHLFSHWRHICPSV